MGNTCCSVSFFLILVIKLFQFFFFKLCLFALSSNFPLPDQQVSSLPVPSALSMSGSLPDLSSLHLPSPLPVGQDSEPHSGAEQMSNTSTHPDITADFNLPGMF